MKKGEFEVMATYPSSERKECSPNKKTHFEECSYGKAMGVFISSYIMSLIDAVKRGKKAFTEYVKNNPNPDFKMKDDYGNTALMIAIDNEKLSNSVIKYLIDKCDVNSQNEDDSTALSYAVTSQYSKNENIGLVKFLLENGCNVNPNGKGVRRAPFFEIIYPPVPLLIAMSWGRMKTAMLLLEHGANINVVNNDGKTPLMLSANCNNLAACDVFKFILTKHVDDVNIVDNDGKSALAYAVESMKAINCELLLKHGAKIEGIDVFKIFGEFFDIDSFKKDAVNMMTILVNHNFDINIQDTDGHNLLTKVSEIDVDNKCIDFVRFLLINKINIDHVAGDRTALMNYSKRNALTFVLLFLDHNANASLLSADGMRATTLTNNKKIKAVLLLYANYQKIAEKRRTNTMIRFNATKRSNTHRRTNSLSRSVKKSETRKRLINSV